MSPPKDEPPKKKLKITATNGQLVRQRSTAMSSHPPRRVKGRLAQLPHLPLDVLFEVLGHLHPLDLLHLARTNKEFRRVLMHRSSITVWKSSLESVSELPECPPDLSLPAWANLAFDHHCYNCLTGNVRTVYWMLRVRLCSKCGKLLLEPRTNFDKTDKKDNIILRCVPFDSGSTFGDRYCFTKAREAFIRELNALPEERSDFVKKRSQEIKKKNEHASLCRLWVEKNDMKRDAELTDIRKQRKDAITAKLKELGHQIELEYLEEYDKQNPWRSKEDLPMWDDFPQVRAPKPLTERVWSNMRPIMEEYMSRVKSHRLADERKQIVQKRRLAASSAWFAYRSQNYEPGEHLPSLLDIWCIQQVDDLVQAPNDREANEGTFQTLFQKFFPSLIRQWSRATRVRLASDVCIEGVRTPWSLWPDWTTSEFQSTDCLLLAATVFSCSNPMDMHEELDIRESQYSCMWYPEFLHHTCNSMSRRYWGGDDNVLSDIKPRDETALKVLEYNFGRRRKWSPEHLHFNEKASFAVQKILESCGLDHRKATVAEMDKLDPRLICLKCSYGAKIDGERRFKVMTWRVAVQHCMKIHWGDARVRWQCLSDDDVAEAKILEAKEPARRGLFIKPKIWRCTLCSGKSSEPGLRDLGVMKAHYDLVHGIDESEVREREHYFRAPDVPPVQPFIVQMVPRVVSEETMPSPRE